MRVRALLFPDPPRRIPRHRALGLTLRTAHLMTFGALLGGHFFDVDPARLLPFLVATIASGGGIADWLQAWKVGGRLKRLTLSAVPRIGRPTG